jgi:hypothetical protein
MLEKDIAIRNEQRKKEKEETKAKVEEVLNRKPLYKQKEEIIKNMEQSELEKKKETLKRLRSLSKPIDLTEIAEHKNKYYEAKMKKDKELNERREKILLEIQDKNRMDEEIKSKYTLINRDAALQRFHEERS